MRLRKALCLVLIFAMLACLCVPASADVSLFFVAVNDTVPLTLTVLPTYSGGTLYVPYQVFDSQPCGVTPSYNQTKQTYVLLDRSKQMLFDLAAGTVSDESGNVSAANVLYRNGILYLPLTFCTSHFGLKTTMLESAGGYSVLRFTNGSEVYDDSLFIEKAENLIAYRVQQYTDSANQPQDRPQDHPNGGQQTADDEPAAEKQPATVYLAFTDSSAMRDAAAALAEYDLPGSFFLTAEEIQSDPALVFELLAAGHAIGVTAEADAPDPAEALNAANDALAGLLCQKTLLALLPAGAEAPEGYSCFYRSASQPSAADAAASETAHLLVCTDDASATLYTFFSANARILQLLETTEYPQ